MLMIVEQPMWTDIWQTIAAVIGIPATIVGFIILFIKDRNKENQIQKLSDIASHLSKMVDDSENRYVQTRRPILDIEAERIDNKQIRLLFKNWNLNSIVQKYSITNLEPNSYMTWVSNENSQFQEFSIEADFHIEPSFDGAQFYSLRYETIEGYVFVQDLAVKANAENSDIKVTQLQMKIDQPQN